MGTQLRNKPTTTVMFSLVSVVTDCEFARAHCFVLVLKPLNVPLGLSNGCVLCYGGMLLVRGACKGKQSSTFALLCTGHGGGFSVRLTPGF